MIYSLFSYTCLLFCLNQIFRLPPHYLFSFEVSKALSEWNCQISEGDQETPKAVSFLFQVESLHPQLASAVLKHTSYPSIELSSKSVFPALDSRFSFLTHPSHAFWGRGWVISLSEFISQDKVITTPSKPCSESSFIIVILEFRFVNP